jgi:hypothetical protein
VFDPTAARSEKSFDAMRVPYFTWLTAITRLITNDVHFSYLPLLIDLR